MSENKRFKIDIDEILKAKVKKKLPKFLVNFLKRRIHQEEIDYFISSLKRVLMILK